ncbi:MAG: hypothetical protein ACR2MD_11725 [Aridibacter sp.]
MPVKQTKKEQFIDAIIGKDEEITDELASKILIEFGIDESRLLGNFKNSIQHDLREMPPESKEFSNLRNTLRNITEYQRSSLPDIAEPKDYIANLINSIQSAFQKPVFSFRNRKNEEMSENDKMILNELQDELNNEAE